MYEYVGGLMGKRTWSSIYAGQASGERHGELLFCLCVWTDPAEENRIFCSIDVRRCQRREPVGSMDLGFTIENEAETVAGCDTAAGRGGGAVVEEVPRISSGPTDNALRRANQLMPGNQWILIFWGWKRLWDLNLNSNLVRILCATLS